MVQPPLYPFAIECLYSPEQVRECWLLLLSSYVSVLSLHFASFLGIELSSPAWDKVSLLPPLFGAPWSSRLAPEGAQLRVQPQTECQDPELAS